VSIYYGLAAVLVLLMLFLALAFFRGASDEPVDETNHVFKN